MAFRRSLVISQVVAVLAFTVIIAAFTSMQASAEVGMDDIEQRVLDLINEERARNGLGPLVATQTLDAAADWMAQDIATMAELSHTDTLGRDLRTRLNAFDYPSNSTIRENIAAGYSGADEVVQAWIDSPGHYANILAPEATAAGVALHVAPGTAWYRYWVIDFGSVIDSPQPVAPSSGAQTTNEQPAPTIPTVELVSIAGSVPEIGVGLLLVQEDATPEQLVATVQAAGCVNATIWISEAGQLIGYLPGAPSFVNRDFPPSVAASTPFIASCK